MGKSKSLENLESIAISGTNGKETITNDMPSCQVPVYHCGFCGIEMTEVAPKVYGCGNCNMV